MSIISKYTINSLELDNRRIDLFWEYTKALDPLKYEVWVECSGAMSGPFEILAKTYNAKSYTDRSNEHSDWRRSFYRLRVVRRKDGAEVQLTEALCFEPEPDVILREIRRRTNLLLREYTGLPTLYYPVRDDGARCPECWDELARQRTKSHCTSCFDTGFLLGYYNPILLHVQIHEEQTALAQNAEVDELGVRPATAIVPGELPVSYGDLILEKTGVRWSVAEIDRTEKLRARSTMRLRLTMIPESDVRYRIPLPEADLFTKMEKSREYTRPYTLNP